VRAIRLIRWLVAASQSSVSVLDERIELASERVVMVCHTSALALSGAAPQLGDVVGALRAREARAPVVVRAGDDGGSRHAAMSAA
jgi:hypothetical protein